MDIEQLTRQIREAAARVTNAPSAQAYTEAYEEWAELCVRKEHMMAAQFGEDY
jgi:uncharacterized protein (DUF697 family)